MNKGIGQPVRRREDLRLLTGQGCFSDDVNISGQAHGFILRSPQAHAIIKRIETDHARSMPGVQAILTGDDYLKDGMGGIPHPANPFDILDPKKHALENKDGAPIFLSPNFPLATDKIRHIGEPLAIIIADNLEQAKDAAEHVVLDLEPLPAVIDPVSAMAEGAPLIWQEAEQNICIDLARGDQEATDQVFKGADHVVTMELVNPRVAMVPMEPRGAVADYDTSKPNLEFLSGSQGAFFQHVSLSRIFGLEMAQVRVVSRDVGGGFGGKHNLYPEYVLAAWASKRLNRPVKWNGDRGEAFLSDLQARDFATEAELALTKEGRFLGLRVRHLYNVGAHTVSFVPLANGARIITGCYKFDAAHLTAKAVLTNTVPTAQYRGAGRPEATFNIERLIDQAAAETGLDRIELRRKNIIDAGDLPFTTYLGIPLESVDFPRNMETAIKAANWDSFDARRAISRQNNNYRGIGLANYFETPTGRMQERVNLKINPTGNISLIIGTGASGQGHETTFSQIVADQLGVDFDLVEVLTGDTAFVTDGGGSHSVRSTRLGGTLITWATTEIIDQGKKIAARHFEAAEQDIEYQAGDFKVNGTNLSIRLFDLPELPETEQNIDKRLPAYPCGTAICEVEVDGDTGRVEIVKYTAVDDVGRAINPLLVHGQIHGGIAQGAGQAMMEQVTYDSANGQLLSGSFMDYAMPRADDLPDFDTVLIEIPAASNPLGIKAAGEGGTTPAPAAITNAVADALREAGVENIAMPLTADRIWRAMKKAGHF